MSRAPNSFFHVDNHMSHHLFVKKTKFPHSIILAFLSKSADSRCMGLFLTLNFIPLIYISILIPIPHTLDYYSFVMF